MSIEVLPMQVGYALDPGKRTRQEDYGGGVSWTTAHYWWY